MNRVTRLSLLVAASLCFASAVHATTFNYQYIFGDGNIASGSLEGDLNGQFVDNVSNVSLYINGSEITGTIFTAAYTPPSPPFTPAGWIAGPIVSFDALQNNFIFSDVDPNALGNDDSFFSMRNSSVYIDQAYASSGPLNLLDVNDTPTVSGNWSLQVAGVPDGGLTVAMLSLALLGLAGMRRKLGT